MKQCPYCGKQYSDEYLVCALDETPLESRDAKPRGAVVASNSMGNHRMAFLISGACIIASIAFVFISFSGGPGALGVAAILGGFMAVKVIMFVSAIAFIVQGFKVHWGWGVANTFLGPLAGIVFFIKHRQKGSVPIYILVYGFLLLLLMVIIAICAGH